MVYHTLALRSRERCYGRVSSVINTVLSRFFFFFFNRGKIERDSGGACDLKRKTKEGEVLFLIGLDRSLEENSESHFKLFRMNSSDGCMNGIIIQ